MRTAEQQKNHESLRGFQASRQKLHSRDSEAEWQRKSEEEREGFLRQKRLEMEVRLLRRVRSYAEVLAAGDGQLRPGAMYGGGTW